VAGVTSAIFTPGPNLWPPSVDLNTYWLNCTVPPEQAGSSTRMRSAATYRVPLRVSTNGCAPMSCWKVQVVRSCWN
jgi:hypothetical protein